LKNKPTTVHFFKKVSYGFSLAFYKIFLKKFEIPYKLNFNSYEFEWTNTQNLAFNIWVSTFFNSFLSLQEFVNKIIIINYLRQIYKAKRQALSLPSRGQRTWSNA
jgi:hypothetical protein